MTSMMLMMMLTETMTMMILLMLLMVQREWPTRKTVLAPAVATTAVTSSTQTRNTMSYSNMAGYEALLKLAKTRQ